MSLPVKVADLKTPFIQLDSEFLGIPFNLASYSVLTFIVAKICGLEPYEFIHYGGDCHIYSDHTQQCQ